MSSLAFSPPQFSDDVAWLPPWLLPNQSPTTSSQHTNPHNQIVKDPNASTNGESKYNICRLYLSEEDSTPTTLTPSCEKTLHLNLHLSTVETSSIVSSPPLSIEKDEKKELSLALVDSKGKGLCYTGHDSSQMNIVPPYIENISGCSGRQTTLSNSGMENTSEGSNHKCVECDDICDAVELSVAASEALVIRKESQSESFANALSMSAILEAALKVKQARLDGKKESSCCFKDFGDAADILSDLGDTDMEDAYNDVGLDLRVFDNVLLQEPSLSRVKETPLSELPGEDKEVQCRLLGDLEIDLDNNFATDFLEHCPATNKSDNIPAKIFNDVKLRKLFANLSVDLVSRNHLQNATLDDLQTQQEGKVDVTCVDISPLEVGVKSSHQFQHSRKEARFECPSTTVHAHYSGTNEESGNASCRFRSRLGGWTGMDAVKSNVKHRKTINYFIEETSYLSESVDIFPDQNSVIYDCHRSSNASESNRPFEDSFKAASEGAFASQEVVKSSSYVEPLCSVVPCSISAEVNDTIQPANIYNNHQALDAFKSLPFGREFLMKNSLTGSGDKNDNAGSEEHNELDMDDVGLVIPRKLTSLRTYSTGPPCVSFKKNMNSGILRLRENEARVISDLSKFQNDKATTDQPPVKFINCPAAKSMQEDEENNRHSVEQCQNVYNTSKTQVSDKQPPAKPVSGCTAATNKIDNYSDYAFAGLGQETFEQSDDNEAEKQDCFKDIPASPLVLCHRTRRFKAPKLPVGDATSDKQLIDQGPALEKQYYQKNSEGKCYNLHKSDIPARKRVHFSDDSKLQNPQDHEREKLRRIPINKYRPSYTIGIKPEICHREQGTTSQEVKECLTKCRLKGGKKLIFQGLDFLLTGFSKNKQKEIEGLLRKHGGMVLSDIPAVLPHPKRRKALKFNAEKLPVVLCTKKLQTTRFLYGCAVNAFLLRVGWAYNSIRVGSVLPPDKYLILSHQIKGKMNQIGKTICQTGSFDHIFGKTGIMLHGTHSFFNKLAKVIKYGQGHVFKSLQWLVQSIEKKQISLAVIVVEDEHRATRHLKKCASEQNITVMPARWVINSLYQGKLLPLMENNYSSNSRVTSVSEVYNPQDWSQEI